MKMKKHVIEVAESFSRYFIVEGVNSEHCIERVEELCNQDLIDVTNLGAESTTTNQAEFSRNVRQICQVTGDPRRYEFSDSVQIPICLDGQAFAQKHGSPKFALVKQINEMLEGNDHNLDGSDKYAEGYHDALLDMLDFLGIHHSNRTHFD